jgi:hypothetical protein
MEINDSFEKKYLKFINGNYSYFNHKSTTLRLFLISKCSEDNEIERNFIMKYVYKDLKDKYDDIIVCFILIYSIF